MGLQLETCLNQRAGPTQLTRNLTSSYCFCDPFSRGPVHPALISFSFNNKNVFFLFCLRGELFQGRTNINLYCFRYFPNIFNTSKKRSKYAFYN